MNPLSTDLHSQQLDNEASPEDHALDPELMLEQILADPHLFQHIVRTHRDGSDTIVGYFRCPFLPGQQRHILHIPFSPPLATVPSVEALVPERTDVRVRSTDQQKFGVRLEIILPRAAESEMSLLVEAIVRAEF